MLTVPVLLSGYAGEIEMNRARRDILLLFLLSLATRLVVATFIRHPGYMDAAYYTAGAVQLAQGDGLSEPFLWNYLDDPAGIPHPGFLYWMPLPSLLAAPFAALLPGSFFALQFPFALLSALLPLVAYGLAWEVTGRRRDAWLAGLLTLFSGFFFPYWTLPETFTPFALFGSTALWLSAHRSKSTGKRGDKGAMFPASCLLPLASGVLVGLAHLTRADGVLLLPVVALAPLVFPQPRTTQHATHSVTCHSSFRHLSFRHLSFHHLSFVILGYLLAMAPWFLRNIALIGAPLSPTGTQTLWLRTYDDIFCYNCDLSLRSYLAWGWPNILRSKLWAAGINLERFLAEDCLIFLLPFTLLGLYRLRRHPSFTLSLIYLALIYLAHSLAFTFPGPRGGFFHASAALLPFLHAAAAEGLDAAIRWAARRRRWNTRQARRVFAAATVALALTLSVHITVEKLPSWRTAYTAYEQIGQWLAQEEPTAGTVMVANPPAFWYYTDHPCVVVPNGDVETLLATARRYDVSHVVLDENRPLPLAALYAGETTDGRLEPAGNFNEVVVYRVQW